MSFLGINFRRKTELPPIDVADRTNNESDVIETIAMLDLPPDSFVVAGSSAMTLLGLDRCAHDVDLVINQDYLDRLKAIVELQGHTLVTEVPSSKSNFLHFKADTRPLPSDLFAYSPHYPIRNFDDLRRSRTVQDSHGFTVESPSELLYYKQYFSGFREDENGIDRRKKLAQDMYDIFLLEQYISTRTE